MKKCPDCPKFSTCTALCAEAEAYVNQDYMPQNEISTDKIEYIRIDKFKLLVEWQSSSNIANLTKREKEILMLLGKGLSRADVCELLDITKNNLRVYINILSKKVKKF